jgi:GDP-L-fucose synthase
MNKDARIFLAGHGGMVGTALQRRLVREGFHNIITRSHAALDLTDQQAVHRFFAGTPLDCVFLAAARVGGIQANNAFPAEFIYENLAIQTNVIHAAHTAGVRHLLFLGSSCIYPKMADQPIREEALMSGWLEPTNEPYAIAKIAGIKMCEAYNRQYGTRFRAVMPTNLYGPNDNYDLESSHVLPALIRKCHLAKLAEHREWEAIAQDEQRYGKIPDDVRVHLGLPQAVETRGRRSDRPPKLVLWGTGTPYREFLHVDDLAAACLFIMRQPDQTLAEICRVPATESTSGPAPNLRPETFLLNVGTGEDQTIRALADLVRDVVGFGGDIVWDETRPDGTPRKLLDVSRLGRLGWRPTIALRDGIAATYRDYLQAPG